MKNNLKDHTQYEKNFKKFVHRSSILTDIFENSHVQIVYNIYLTAFFGFFINFVVRNYINTGEITFGTKNIINGFQNFHLTLFCWCIFFTFTCLGYFIFKQWLKIGNNYSRHFNMFCFIILIGYYVFSFEFCAFLITHFHMGPAAGFFLATEQTRLLMKLHAFVRSNILRTGVDPTFPTFSYYVKFLFFPTLIFRDSYPQTTHIRWKFALLRLLEVIAALFLFSFITDPVLNSTTDFGKHEHTVSDIILLIFENSISGMLTLLTCFFMILHSLQNFFAEITRFGDRMFYREWWNATDYSEWFRTWNVIVYDWLHTYIYKDAMTFISPNNKYLAKFFVFAISAVVHEWINTCALGFWFPLLFVQFFVCGGLLSLFTFPKTSTSNVLILYGLSFGTGSLITLYGIEYFIRQNMAETSRFLIPQIFTTTSIVYR